MRVTVIVPIGRHPKDEELMELREHLVADIQRWMVRDSARQARLLVEGEAGRHRRAA